MNIFTHFLVIILMIHSFNYGAACFSGVSNESLSTKVPIYQLSACFYLGFFIYPLLLLIFHSSIYDYIEACQCSSFQYSNTFENHLFNDSRFHNCI